MRQLRLKFEGIDDFNRSVFVRPETGMRCGDTNNLFALNATKEEVMRFYNNQPKPLRDFLVIFGYRFGCEPDGVSLAKDVEVIIIPDDVDDI